MDKVKILTVGVFDYFHYGHLQLFKKIKNKYPNSYLIVAVQKDSYITVCKPQARIFYSDKIRKLIISQLRCVDKVISYTTVDEIVKKSYFDILAIGEDQKNIYFLKAIEWCKKHNKKIIKIKRTKNISSSFIKDNIISDYKTKQTTIFPSTQKLNK